MPPTEESAKRNERARAQKLRREAERAKTDAELKSANKTIETLQAAELKSANKTIEELQAKLAAKEQEPPKAQEPQEPQCHEKQEGEEPVAQEGPEAPGLAVGVDGEGSDSDDSVSSEVSENVRQTLRLDVRISPFCVLGCRHNQRRR